ncbi:TonB-dependent receptor [Pseudomonas sp. MYb2]|uniref:TonB-dependent receptor n=1 Tax=unclassified Pseudomonas TaxID=196821 RepID=UPI000D001A60|nr:MULTISPECIES: TonB-dependent receptor [unclassified Pseudomonas]PRB50934.1 TonB-dependent receptor [Pseudomonas sp. MYb3]PRC34313.1 TonB-dependent receptor [Pseudomonas sp. MYb2]
MKLLYSRNVSAGALGLCSLMPLLPATASDLPDNNDVLQTVTVESRRRSEDAQQVPTAMSVLGAQTLEEQRLYRLQDLQQAMPSVNVAFMHARQSSLSIRGLGNNPASDGLEGSAGIYLDNVYLGRPGMAVFDLLDVEQIELLRGPQGTLFGKNTTAGVLNITTRRPSSTPQGSFASSVGEDGYSQNQASFSGPLNDTLSGRIAAYKTHENGYVKNEFDGHTLGGGVRQGVRGQLLFQPNDDFNLRWLADYHEEDSSAGTRSLFSTGPTINGVNRYEQRAAAVGATLVDGRRVNLDADQNVTVFQGGTSLEANWNLRNDYTLTSISAYRWWDFTPRNDDELNVDVMHNVGQSARDKQYSQEIRLASPVGEHFDYVLGAYYFRQEMSNKVFTDYGPLADTWNGTPQGALNNVTSVGHGDVDTDSFATFAQGTWHLTPVLDFSLGVRGTYERKLAQVTRNAPVGGAGVSGAAAAARAGRSGAYDSGDLSLYSFSPSALASLAWHVSDEVLAYASLSHGEKSGGVNLSVASAPVAGADSLLIGSERANDAELGIKTTLLDQRLLLNANLFWTVVHGYQTNAYDDVNLTSYLTNAGTVRSRGLELDSSWRPISGLTINVNGSFNDVRYLSYDEAPCPAEVALRPGAPAACDLSGHAVVGASKWIFNSNASYQWNLQNGLQPYVNGSYAWRSHAVGTVDDSREAQLPGYGLVNLSSGVRGDWGKGQWDVSLWMKNAFDKTYYTTLWNSPNGAYTGVLGTPRTVGMTARYDF